MQDQCRRKCIAGDVKQVECAFATKEGRKKIRMNKRYDYDNAKLLNKFTSLVVK